MMSTRTHHPPAMSGPGEKPPTSEGTVSSIVLLEEKARRLLKRCRYEESAKTFKEVVDMLQLQRQNGQQISPYSSANWSCQEMVSSEVGALEGIAICHSRMLNDAEAELAQRKALALRCQAWEGVSVEGSSDSAMGSARALAAKKAAVPCLRNLASFVSNQGRHVDAEVVLRTVLEILELRQPQPRRSGSSSSGGTPDRTSGRSSPPLSTTDTVPDNTVPGDPGSASSERQSRNSAGENVGVASPTAASTMVDAAELSEEEEEEESSPLASRPPRLQLPTTPKKRPGALIGGGGSYIGRQEENGVAAVGSGGEGGDGGGGGGSGSGSKKERDLEDLELDEAAGEGEQNVEQVSAVTRHHLAVVIHAQGRVEEARQLLEGSVATLRRTFPSQPIWLAQALHDLAGVVCPSSPARACTLYREALKIFETTRGVNHFVTAPTLAKLGSLLGDSFVAAAAIPPAPAAPAGPGAAGVARAAGLAEAVCAPGERRGSTPSAAASAAEAVAAVAGKDWDAKEAEAMIKRAVLIQGRHLGLRHPAVASSMRAMAELYRRQGRLSEAEPLLRRAIGIWEASPGPMDADAVAALHGLAHCVLAGPGADWLGRFEEAFDLMDQAYRISSSQPGNLASSRLLLEALRMIRSRQRQGRGDPQPASAAIMDGVWSGRWDPANSNGDDDGSTLTVTAARGHRRNSSSSSSGRIDSPRCAVCLEEIGWGRTAAAAAATPASEPPREEMGGTGSGFEGERSGDSRGEGVMHPVVARSSPIAANIGSEEAVRAETEDAHARGRFAYLPCGHRFHTHCIGRWLAHSSTCPSCRRRVEDDSTTETETTTDDTTHRSSPNPAQENAIEGSPGDAGTRREVAVSTRSVATQARANDTPGQDEDEGIPSGGGGSSPGSQGGSDGRAPFC